MFLFRLCDMEIIFFLIHCIMAVSLSMAQTQNVTTPAMTPALKSTQTTGNVILFNTTVSSGNESGTTYTSAITSVSLTSEETTVHLQTSQSTAIMTQQKHSTSLTTPGTQTQPSTVLTTTSQTTAGYTSIVTSTAVISTANSSHTVNTTSDSKDRITHGKSEASLSIYMSYISILLLTHAFFIVSSGSGLSDSERNMTVVFTVGLGAFLVTLVVIMLHRYKHRVQYFHQPLNDSVITGKKSSLFTRTSV